MSTRNEIANELMRDCPDEYRSDHAEIAAAIIRGDDASKILAVADDYPETYVWLKSELAE